MTRKVHISSLATSVSFPRSSSRCASSDIARSPAGVAAQPSPRIFATKLADIEVRAGCSFGILGKRKPMTGFSSLVIPFMIPASTATSISPDQNATIPNMVKHSVTASLDEASTASVISFTLPVSTPYTIPVNSIPPHK